MIRALVTGGCGFIGSALVRHLVGKRGPASVGPRRSQVRFVTDRPGHDQRYAIDATHIANTLGFRPEVAFEEGLRRTVAWYLDNRDWWAPLVERGWALDRVGLRGAETSG